MKDMYFSLMLPWSEPQEKIVQEQLKAVCLALCEQRRASHENNGYQ